ncbi:MAG: prolyl oligopeptidase family serine peptidase [Verrucomicrobiales bacterium]|nr:prolyl oligopeptidase family serine peptidase [Verrucomicrobiales bacterium]
MKYFLTPPATRRAIDEALSVDEIRSAVQNGTIQGQTILYGENNSLPLPAERIIAKPPPIPRRTSAATQTLEKSGDHKTSLAPLWIGLGIFAFLILLTAGAALGMVHFIRKAEMSILSETSLQEERKAHTTKWQKNAGFEPAGPPPEPDGKILKLIRYPSENGELAAYLTPDPGDGKKHPVMIWSKGGFGGIGDYFWDEPSRLNDQSARAFREAGIVLMCPSYRGENDNPGKFELFYGEVDDFLAAVDYAKNLPWVDPDRIYIGGHSTGGTISLLAATTGIDCRAVFSFGGEPDLSVVMADGEGYDNTPYDIKSEYDHKLRSPIRYTNFIKSPTYYIEGGAYEYSNNDAKKMERLAKKKAVPFKALVVDKADHFDILTSSTRLIAQKILADTGDTPISLTEAELNSAWWELNGISLTSELNSWMQEGGDLAAILKNLETDVEVTSFSELDLIKSAVEKVLSGTPNKNNDIAELTELCDYISDKEITAAFFERIGPLLENYIQGNLKNKNRSKVAEANCMRIAGTFAYSGHTSSAPLIAKLAIHQFDPDNINWTYVIDEIVEQSETGKAVTTAFQQTPPKGALAEKILSKINNTLVDDPEAVESHPYNSENGAKALREMIEEDGDATFQSTLALAFIDEKLRKSLLPPVLDHPNLSVRLEAAWVDAKHGGNKGVEILTEACKDLDYSETAKGYFRELEIEDKIPVESLEPNFTAKAKMVKWLQHPNELGSSPASIEQIDSRKLFWPPDEKQIDLWIFRFTYRFDEDKPLSTSYGIVAGQAWSSFQEYDTEPTVAELYGHHCALELKWKDDSSELSSEQGLELLRKKNPGKL